MVEHRKVLTLHAPLGKAIAYELLGRIEDGLRGLGATRVWISTENLPDLTLMAEVEVPDD